MSGLNDGDIASLENATTNNNNLRGRVNQVLLDVRLQFSHSHVQAGDVLQRARKQYV